MTDRNPAAMSKSGKAGERVKVEDGKGNDRDKPAAGADAAPANAHKSPKKRRKERPCTRCIKRNIGHLCHDEPRDADSKKAKSIQTSSVVDESDAQSDIARSSISSTMGPPPPNFDGTRRKSGFATGGVLGQGNPLPIVQPGPVSGLQGNTLNNGNNNANQFAGFQDAWMTAQNHFHDMHTYHPNYMIAPEVTHEFSLLNDFLHTSLLDDGGVPSDDQQSPAFRRSSQSEMLPAFGNNNSLQPGGVNSANMSGGPMLPPPNLEGKNILRPGSVVPADKAREYYLQAADPSGNDTPEERMARVLKAKYDAGLLKPFNYIKGYARLGTYLDSHIAPSSKQKILRTINQFRPKFREKAQALTDMELVYVEMWFEKQLMDYDRVFASMAVPACCWRRTGEIFRGNKEMAELIGVSVDKLRDGKIALHEILTEESTVRYWEEFGTIAFDPAHETLLTACSLKNPSSSSSHPIVKCCFSFMIRRDDHKLKELLSTLLNSRDSTSIEALLADLNHNIHTANALPLKTTSLSPQTAKSLKDCGRKLWNECIKERRRKNDGLAPGRAKLLVRTRVFAFLIHALARENHQGKRKRDDEEEVVYLMHLALTVGRLCVEESDLDGARLGLHKVADYIEQLKSMAGNSQDDPNLRSRLEAEYLTMRTALSWKEDRLDVAEHMYSKAEPLRQHLDPSSAEHMADTLQHIGSDLSSKGDYAMALKWLRRAYEMINGQELERLSAEGLELRLAICHHLVQVLLAIGSPEHLREADDLVAYVESEIGDKPVVLHWKLEILQKSPSEVFDTDACASILRRMIRSIDFSDAALGFLLHSIKDLHDRNSRLTMGLLDELLLTRLLPSGNPDWIGKALVRRVWMSSMDPESSNAATDLMGLLMRIPHDSGNLLDADVTIAAQSYKAAELWCRVALHAVFSNCGEANQGKFGRKLIICAIACNDIDAARSAFNDMPSNVQEDPLTRYLMFKASLTGWDHELGCQSIEHLSRSSDKEKSQDILYACVREAQQVGDRLCTLAALKAVVDKCDSGESSRSHFPSILRCTIRLIHLIESQEGEVLNQDLELAEDTCKIFEKAAENSRLDTRDGDGNKVFTGLWHLVRIFSSCLTFIECFPPDIPSKDIFGVQIMEMRCHFIISAALVSQARTEDKVEEQLQRYVEMRQHIASFDKTFELVSQNEPDSNDGPVMGDMLAKLSTLFVFDFEGALCLKGWDDLGQIVRKARICKDELMYKAMGDSLLRSQAPGKVLYATMRAIINQIFELEDFDNQRLAKYVRCMFQAILPLDDSLALQVVDQALQIAREGSQMQKPFPGDELDWIVATTFNHAIDILARGDEPLCHQWALKALDMTEYMSDGGDMRNLLQERVVKLGFGKDTH
ncbi:meiosis protein SPO22/ZIP4 like-domain-containing protein [Ilyonectria robusta]|uniref:meiosis protein SPO22/ZIP4 like-domain-containing protein n=1 Tax=Ilyonectria robusta TaxID=1079257 RepID=UPI001E8CAF93|nr:meiosis protein SPO22/ZIP4 like-domain-containing protein [Ilyonectria robusta]KAH8714206.1 meiosis protein SPO22/ZIP4 like-domain-containing protein [Ilyonectria robusta]